MTDTDRTIFRRRAKALLEIARKRPLTDAELAEIHWLSKTLAEEHERSS